jgi:protein-disulfide isomerase
VKFILKHFPLNPKCNPGVTNTAHPAACDAAAAAVMAQSVGTFDKLTDWFFMHQNDLTPATVRSAADDVGGIKDFEARYSQAIEQVKADAAAGVKLGVESTPTFFINGRKSPGLSADALDTLIELELRRASRQP